MLDPYFATKGFTIKHRERIDDAIKRVARKVGEQRFAMPDIPQKIHNDHIVAATAELWNIIAGGKHVEGLKSIHKTQSKDSKDKTEREVHQNVPALIRLAKKNRTLIYDGRGRLTTHRRGNDDVQFVFRDGPSAQGTGRGPSILTRPTVGYDETEFRNHVVVRGGTPKGKKRLIVAESLPPHHPLSPHALARNGEPRYLTSFVDADNLKTWDDCKDRARDELHDLKDAGVTVEFDCLPMPMLEPGDFVRVQTSGFKFDFRVNQFTLPLTPDSPMSIGRTVKVHKFARHHPKRHRKRKKHGGKVQYPSRGSDQGR